MLYTARSPAACFQGSDRSIKPAALFLQLPDDLVNVHARILAGQVWSVSCVTHLLPTSTVPTKVGYASLFDSSFDHGPPGFHAQRSGSSSSANVTSGITKRSISPTASCKVIAGT